MVGSSIPSPKEGDQFILPFSLRPGSISRHTYRLGLSSLTMKHENPLATHSLKELRILARQQGLTGYSKLRKHELLQILSQTHDNNGNEQDVGMGYLDFDKEGKGILRPNYRNRYQRKKIYVSPAQIKRFGLRHGDFIKGKVRKPKSGERYYSLVQILSVNGLHPETALDREQFEAFTPIFPHQQLILETKPHILAPRLIDLLSPIGRGQRGLIFSPPKAGRTTLLKQIVNALTYNYSDIHVLVALIGDRPEEITDVARSVEAEMFSASFDASAYKQVAAAELALNRAQRLVEMRRDVVLVLDSLTRLTRAYNESLSSSGHMLGPDLDAVAIYRAKRFFAAGQKIENGGSLTLLATCLIDSDSPLDTRIAEEFQHTANMELFLSRYLAEKRIFPAIDIERSNTRHEDLLLDRDTIQKVWIMRRMIEAIRHKQPGAEPMIVFRDRLRRSRNNYEFLSALQS